MAPDALTPADLPVRVRDATVADAAACAAVYAPYVRDTTVSFEAEPPTTAQMADRITASLATHAWLVAELPTGSPGAGRVVGYAYAAPYAARAAYRWACGTSVYLEPGRRRTGAGRALYTALLERLAALGYRQAVAGYTEPNPASAGLHASLGFEVVGTLRGVGHKHGAWRDVTLVQRPLGDGSRTPPAPTGAS
ncbi:Phosphinothricin acetyltransferase [Cellulomonas flavigena DSM 20109]|uniref:Phosphinothricin acetyltransferase n=1 Tax=Cellulomonas flavigena (strain ATCC 482 / DSM 20109 / BCRC 11376 / JCM 18109 / NBRC 3775 / NCIMB 8073 / NRS 134) TaxID=446466 RepID=D5UCV6_CELFN|nr:GNAT family N-acetyltransferase [Cellulomonas flavigena]ADG76341.1 Phosphinothricin acetyltransferase [Cellulomonas flavigena DSM 20109]